MLHYGYALVMLTGLFLLRPGFTGVEDRRWWTIALGIQFFHHIEHFLLQGQYLLGQNLFGRPVPTSIVQLWVPRVELHLFYNTIVFIPMIVAMYFHMFPPAVEEDDCTCAWHRGLRTRPRSACPASRGSAAGRRASRPAAPAECRRGRNRGGVDARSRAAGASAATP